MQIERITISSIKVVDRVRDDYGDIEGLAASLRQGGLVQPIVVDEKMRLIAGGRRLKAATMLGWSEIDACIMSGLTPLQKLDLEVQENLVRKDLTDDEIAKSIEMKRRLMRRPWYIRLWLFLKTLFERFLALFKRH